MVTITQPKSVYVDNEKEDSYTLKWENTMSGQTHYEILYKIRSNSTWSTVGKIESTATSFDLRKLHEIFGNDFEEIQYRVLVYYSIENEKGTLTGKEYSEVYSVIFNQGIANTLKFYDGDSVHEYPVFNEIDNKYLDSIEIDSSGTKKIPLVSKDNPLSSNLVVGTSRGKKHVASGEATFKPSGIYGNGYFEQYVPVYTEIYTNGSSPNYASYEAYGSYTTGQSGYVGYTYYSQSSERTGYKGYLSTERGTKVDHMAYMYAGYYTSYKGYTTSKQVSSTVRHTYYTVAYYTGSRPTYTSKTYYTTTYGYYNYTVYSTNINSSHLTGYYNVSYTYYYSQYATSQYRYYDNIQLYGYYWFSNTNTTYYRYNAYKITGYSTKNYVSGYIDSSYTYKYNT